MNVFTMENVSKSYTDKLLLDHVNLGIQDKDRIGVLGINGTGKSTLLKTIMRYIPKINGGAGRGR